MGVCLLDPSASNHGVCSSLSDRFIKMAGPLVFVAEETAIYRCICGGLHDCDETLEKGKGAYPMIEFPLGLQTGLGEENIAVEIATSISMAM